jgi:hypothetical protein
MIDPSPVGEQASQVAFDKGEIGIQSLQLVDGSLRLVDLPELGEAGDDIAQPRRPVPIKRPGASSNLDGLVVMP